MKFLIVGVAIILVLGFGGFCSQHSISSGSDSTDSIFKSYEFPSHPNLTHLCQKRVYGSGREITWDAFASAATPAELLDYYHQKMGDGGFTKDGEGGTWRLPAAAARPNRVLDIMSWTRAAIAVLMTAGSTKTLCSFEVR